MHGGRWNNPGQPIIYSSLNYACSMLEVLVHSNIGRVPKTHKCVIATVPHEASIERHDHSSLPLGWNDHSAVVAREFGDQWYREGRSAVLIVPSVVAHLEFNALVNPNHPDASKIQTDEPIEVVWDSRLFK